MALKRLLYSRIQIIKKSKRMVLCSWKNASSSSINNKKNKNLLYFGQMFKALNSYFIPYKLKTKTRIEQTVEYFNFYFIPN